MSSEWLSLLIWLGVSTFFLVESLANVAVLAAAMRPTTRQFWLLFPLLLSFVMLLLTPWAPWALACLGLALLAQLLRHHLGMRQLAARLTPPRLTWSTSCRALPVAGASGRPTGCCSTPPIGLTRRWLGSGSRA